MAITRIMSGQIASIGMGPPPWAKAGEINNPASLRPLKAPRALSSEFRPHALSPKGLQGGKCKILAYSETMAQRREYWSKSLRKRAPIPSSGLFAGALLGIFRIPLKAGAISRPIPP